MTLPLKRLQSAKPPQGEPPNTEQIDDLLLVLGVGPDKKSLDTKRLLR